MQIKPHLLNWSNVCPLQSGLRSGHAIVTAPVKLLNDVYTAGNDRRCTVVISLDISTEFDNILLCRLQTEFSLHSTAPLDWLGVFLPVQQLRVRKNRSTVIRAVLVQLRAQCLDRDCFACHMSTSCHCTTWEAALTPNIHYSTCFDSVFQPLSADSITVIQFWPIFQHRQLHCTYIACWECSCQISAQLQSHGKHHATPAHYISYTGYRSRTTSS